GVGKAGGTRGGWIVRAGPAGPRAGNSGGGRDRPVGDDLRSERHEGDRDQLERLDAERDPDDRDAQDHATDEAVHRQPQPGEDDPDDVADDAQRARHAVRVLDMTAEGPQSEAGQLERLDPERDRDDEDEHHDPGDDEPDGEPDPDEDQPQDVA